MAQGRRGTQMAGTIDVVVVGPGMAGLTASLFAARSGSSTVLVGEVLGGELLNVAKIEDFPGFADGVSGYELLPSLQEQVERAGASFEMATALAIEPEAGAWLVRTSGGDLRARAVIVSTGEGFAPLGVPGEVELVGKGVSHCATCDGPMVRGRPAAVVGGGDSGLQEALELARHATTVLVFERREELEAQWIYRERIAALGSVEVLTGTEVDEIVGDGRVTSVWARHRATGERRQHRVEAVFVYGGMDPVAPRLPDLARDGGGHLVTDDQRRTSLPGVFAAGGIRAGFPGQAVVAAGDGATAALAARSYLRDGVGWLPEG